MEADKNAQHGLLGISKPSLARVPETRKPCSFQQRCQKPSNASVFGLWKERTRWIAAKELATGWSINIFVSKRAAFDTMTRLMDVGNQRACYRLWSDKRQVDELTREFVASAEGFTVIWIKQTSPECYYKNGNGRLGSSRRCGVAWYPCLQLRYLQDQKAMFTVVLGKQGNPLPLFRQMKWAICKSLRTWLKADEGMKPATAGEAFKRKQTALKKIRRDFEDEKSDQLWEVWQDAPEVAAEFTLKVAMYILSLTVQDQTAFQVEIAREKPYHLNHPVVALMEKARWPWKWPSWRPTSWPQSPEWPWWTPWFQVNKITKDFEGKNKRPHRTSMKNGFVIRNKGDK